MRRHEKVLHDMRKFVLLTIIILCVLFFYHQYRFAGPEDAILRKEAVTAEVVLKNLKRWRYHDYVWFEFVPDALTTVFKRLGVGGWSETGHRVCVEGCPYWTERWTDGFYTVDLEINKLSIDSNQERNFVQPRFIDVEIWGAIRTKLTNRDSLPQVGQKMRVCGPLRVDRPYHVYTIHPDSADDIQNFGTCKMWRKNNPDTFLFVEKTSCKQLSQMSLSDQIAIVDDLSDYGQSKAVEKAIGKAIGCISPLVLKALATKRDVYEKLVSLAPSIQSSLPPLEENQKQREDNPILNTIRDLLGF